MVFRTASFLLVALVAIIGGVNSAAIGDDGIYDDSEWPAGISPLDSLSDWINDESEEASEVDNRRTCCLPRQWTGRLFNEYRVERARGSVTFRFQQVTYFDLVNKRLASDLIVGNRTVSSQILLFNKTGATRYRFWKTRKWCIKQFVPRIQIRPQCIPSNATLLRSFSLGAGSGALKTQSWGYRFRNRRTDNAFNVILTPGNCIPVISAFVSTTRDTPRRRTRTIIGTLYTDMKTSILDQSVFTPPRYCKKGEEEEEEAEEYEAAAAEAEETEGGEREEDEKLYFDHHDIYTNAILESFVAFP